RTPPPARPAPADAASTPPVIQEVHFSGAPRSTAASARPLAAATPSSPCGVLGRFDDHSMWFLSLPQHHARAFLHKSR
uniref:Uncharacterized protein n=1 Tax=Aegilops tauschii subsp. strangulata TaxID=200361 RepID=A0A453ANY1_AEGTS